MQRVTNNGSSYDIETGGYEDNDGNIIHKAVVEVIETGIDESHPDIIMIENTCAVFSFIKNKR